MREIKFRGKVLHNNPMVNPDDGWVEGFYYQDLVNGEISHFIRSSECEWLINPETLGQFTGLRDCNGKEIYEGDILHVKFYRNAFMNETKEFRDAFDVDDLKGELMEEFTSPVEFTECSFGIRDFYLDSFWKDPKHCYPIHDIKVIGNIHTNPELLKGGEQ